MRCCWSGSCWSGSCWRGSCWRGSRQGERAARATAGRGGADAVRLQLEVEHRDGAARTGTVRTARGSFRTPVFMPVGTRGSIRALMTHELSGLRSADGTTAEVLLANTYHLMLRPGAEAVAALGGLHRFTGWDRLMLDGLGRVPGVLPGPEGVRRRGGVPLHLRRQHAPAHAGGCGGDPGVAGGRHPDGARRVRAPAVGAGGAAGGGGADRGMGGPGQGGPDTDR